MKSTESGMNILKGLLDKKVGPEDFDMAAEAAVEAELDNLSYNLDADAKVNAILASVGFERPDKLILKNITPTKPPSERFMVFGMVADELYYITSASDAYSAFVDCMAEKVELLQEGVEMTPYILDSKTGEWAELKEKGE